MNPLNERYPDLLADGGDPALRQCIADLDATCSAFALPPERDAALTRALAEANGVNRPVSGPRLRLRAPWQPARWRLASLALAALLAAGGIGGYLHGQSPTPVNAQTVLHRAAAVSPGANEASHSTYRVSASGGYTGTAEVWVGTDAWGAPTQFALTLSMARDGTPSPELSSRRVLTAQSMQVYEPAANTVTISSPSGSDQDLEGVFVGALVAQKLSRAVDAGQQTAFKLEQQTLDGVSVYALQLPGAASQTFYFNTQSYLLEGADWVQTGRSWQARLDPASYRTMAASAVPAHTFTLNAPTTAHVVTRTPPQAASKQPEDGTDQIISTAAAACNTTPQAFAAALQAGDRSMLAVCQATRPDMTADRLVDALIVPFKSQLDRQVAAGAMTPGQESDDLARVRTKLTYMVAGKSGPNPGKKQP